MKGARLAGFTLIEVLVALVIVALGMGAVLSALTSAADSTIRLREKTFATWVGLNQLAAARLKQGSLALGKTEGDVDFANVRWHWQQQVEEWQISGIRSITIEVRYADTNVDGSRTTTPAGGSGKTSNQEKNWLATVTGFRNDALKSAQGGFPPNWP